MKSSVSFVLVVAILLVMAFALPGLVGYAIVSPPLIIAGSELVYGLFTATGLYLVVTIWRNSKFKSCGFRLLLTTFLIFAFAFPALAETGVPLAPITFTSWLQDNLVYVLGFLLALSELMSVTPWFKGNGLLDSIIKGLSKMLGKNRSGSEG